MDKADERRLLTRFFGAIGVTPDNVTPREAPDFTVALGQAHVGVEVTTLIEAAPRQPMPPQQWTAEARRLVVSAQRQFERTHSAPLVAHFDFTPEWRHDADTSAELSSVLGSIVANLLERIQQGGVAHSTASSPRPGVRWAYVGLLPEGTHSKWVLTCANHVRSASCNDVVTTVAGKEQLLPTYRQAASEIWLLINCDLEGQGVSTQVPAWHCRVETEFDRVFCCDFYSRCVEANCTRPRGAAGGRTRA